MKKKSANHITQVHDKFVRTVMTDLRVAREFFSVHLPDAIRVVTDLENMVFQPRSYIDDVRKETTVDILYKTTMAGHEAFLYLLLEHQSTPDNLMAFRMLRYTCNVIADYLDKENKHLLPLIYPMVIYHGERPYPYSTDIRDIVDAPKELVEQYFLKPFQLIDLGQIEDRELKQHAWSGVMEFALKHIFARDIMPYLQDIAGLMQKIDQSGGRDYIAIVLQYILDRGELKDKKAFFDLINNQISPEVGEKMMSLAEQLRAEGLEKGLEKGIEKGMEMRNIEIAEKLLAEKVELAFIAKVTGLSLAKIQEIQKKH